MGAPISPQRRFVATSEMSLTAEELPGWVMLSDVSCGMVDRTARDAGDSI